MRPQLIAIALACACGGSSGGSPNLDPAFSGTWTGPATLVVSGQGSQSYTARIVIAVSGQTATVADVCLDGSGSITAQGSGETASWQGSLTCPPVAFSNCSSVTEVFQSATTTLNGNALSAQGSGAIS